MTKFHYNGKDKKFAEQFKGPSEGNWPSDTEHGIWETSRDYDPTQEQDKNVIRKDNAPNKDEIREPEYSRPAEESDT